MPLQQHLIHVDCSMLLHVMLPHHLHGLNLLLHQSWAQLKAKWVQHMVLADAVHYETASYATAAGAAAAMFMTTSAVMGPTVERNHASTAAAHTRRHKVSAACDVATLTIG